MHYVDLFFKKFSNYLNWLWGDITEPKWNSFFWWVVGLSVFFLLVEMAKPWREKQKLIRKDFWLDLFYIFFNFFIFQLIFWSAGSGTVTAMFEDAMTWIGVQNAAKAFVTSLPIPVALLIWFLVADFISWNVHRLLHRVPWLWEFHKVHHSVQEMGFAAHVRYHWMENIVYWSFRFMPLALLGAGLQDMAVIHILNVAWGHYNHTNVTIDPRVIGGIFGGLVGAWLAYYFAGNVVWQWAAYIVAGLGIGGFVLGPVMRKIFNSPEMHIWHHARYLPEDRPYGVNFGITLALWDYLWGTDYVPSDGRDIELGFDHLEEFPQDFLGQITYGFTRKYKQ